MGKQELSYIASVNTKSHNFYEGEFGNIKQYNIFFHKAIPFVGLYANEPLAEA